jgi:cell division protein FtsB
MTDLKKHLEEIFNHLELDKETLQFIQSLEDKIEAVKKNNNEIRANKETVEATIYNLDKIIPEDLEEIKNDN